MATRRVLSAPCVAAFRGLLPLRRLFLLLLGVQRLYMTPPIWRAGFRQPRLTLRNGTEYAGAREVCKARAHRRVGGCPVASIPGRASKGGEPLTGGGPHRTVPTRASVTVDAIKRAGAPKDPVWE